MNRTDPVGVSTKEEHYLIGLPGYTLSDAIFRL